MKIGIAVDGNSGIDYLERDPEIRIFRSHLLIEKEEFEDFFKFLPMFFTKDSRITLT
jgi:hypothetical protein